MAWHLPAHPAKQEGSLIYIILLVTEKQMTVREGRLLARKPALSPVTAMVCGTMGFQQRWAQQLWWPTNFG